MVRLRAAVSLVLVLVLALSSPLFAGGSARKEAPEKRPAFLLVDAGRSLWSEIVKLWEKEGSSIDPLGKPAPPPSGTGSTGTRGLDPQGIPTIPE